MQVDDTLARDIMLNLKVYKDEEVYKHIIDKK